jgi:hypothetical protein
MPEPIHRGQQRTQNDARVASYGTHRAPGLLPGKAETYEGRSPSPAPRIPDQTWTGPEGHEPDGA